MRQELSDFFDGHRAASFGVADAFLNGSESFLVFLVKDGGRIVEVNFVGLSHTFTLARISG